MKMFVHGGILILKRLLNAQEMIWALNVLNINLIFILIHLSVFVINKHLTHVLSVEWTPSLFQDDEIHNLNHYQSQLFNLIYFNFTRDI